MLKKIGIRRKAAETLDTYWLLVRIIIPISIITEFLQRLGAIEAVAPMFAPVMGLIGLPPELGLAWLTAMIVGVWGAVPLVFTLVPAASLSVADVTVFSALVLFAHGLPIEQKIIEKVGPRLIATTTLRIVGGLVYAMLLHWFLSYTNHLSAPVNPTWIPANTASNWLDFLRGLVEAMIWMLLILVTLSWCLDILKVTGILTLIMKLLTPFLRVSGIHNDAGHLTTVGLFLGISYGAGLIIQETQTDAISARQVFLSCVLMGFAHSVIDDTIVFLALGADFYGVFVGRIVFAIVATGIIAYIIYRIPDKTFYTYLSR